MYRIIMYNFYIK